ncbi:MAG: ABC transporter substrate-binding protein [Pseudomonadota bacterium]
MNRRDMIAAGGALTITAGCTPSEELKRQPNKRLAISTANEILRLSVGGGGGAGGSEIMNVMLLLFDTLVALDERLGVVSRLAVRWFRTSETEWTFNLHPGVTFTNGERCDAYAVAHSIQHLASMVPAYRFRSQWGEAWPPSARVVDDTTVAISTPVPQVTLPHLLSRVEIIPPRGSQAPDFANRPVGSGPYKVKAWTRGGTLLLEANNRYFLGRPPIDELLWLSISSPAARLMALRAGDVDLAWDIPYERTAIVDEDPRLKVLEYQSIGLAFIAFNFRAKTSPIANPLVRKAMTYAIDARGIHKSLLDSRGELSLGPAPSQVIGAVDAGGYPDRNLAKARTLLAEAGYRAGLDLVLVYEAGNFQHDEDICGAIVAQLDQAGVRVRFDEVPPGAMRQRMTMPDWDLAPNSVPGSFTGQASYHYYQLKSTLGFHSEDVETLLERANRVEEHRIVALEEAMRLLWAQTPYLWSVGVARTFGAVRKLEGMRYIPTNWLSITKAHI